MDLPINNYLAIMAKLISLLLLIVFNFQLAAQDTTQQIVAGRKNDPQHFQKPYVILISADGFRYDYADKYLAPNLRRFRRKGVQAGSMLPSFPSVTFPNHYTLATGLYPSHHGLIYNQFYDRQKQQTYAVGNRAVVEDGSWYGGTPLWVLAEKNRMLSASYHFVGTEAPIQNYYPTYWYRYNETTDIHFRISKVVEWLQLPEDRRPHFISFYFPEVDHAGHLFGPESKQTADAVAYVDKYTGELVKKVTALGLPVNFVFVSDHGMGAVDTVTRINIAAMVDTSRFIIRGGNVILHLYAKDSSAIQPTYAALKQKENGFRVYLPDETPAEWHYRKSDDHFGRFGDIIVVPEYPKVLSSYTGGISPGAHGFDPAIREMHASFYAWGPQIKKRKRIASFENVHVYPFICRILGLTPPAEIDGDGNVLEAIYYPRPGN